MFVSQSRDDFRTKLVPPPPGKHQRIWGTSLKHSQRSLECGFIVVGPTEESGIRAYLQSGLPGVTYGNDEDRLITIGTPHLGSALCTRFGDLLGTRATALKPDAAMIRRLNEEELPRDVLYASLVIRGVAADTQGDGTAYSDLVDCDYLSGLPIDFRQGGDQAVHVQSQNLRLAKCAASYEEATERPIHYVLVRVRDPSPADNQPFEETVHVAAPHDREVQRWVLRLLQDETAASGTDCRERDCGVGLITKFNTVLSMALKRGS